MGGVSSSNVSSHNGFFCMNSNFPGFDLVSSLPTGNQFDGQVGLHAVPDPFSNSIDLPTGWLSFGNGQPQAQAMLEYGNTLRMLRPCVYCGSFSVLDQLPYCAKCGMSQRVCNSHVPDESFLSHSTAALPGPLDTSWVIENTTASAQASCQDSSPSQSPSPSNCESPRWVHNSFA